MKISVLLCMICCLLLCSTGAAQNEIAQKLAETKEHGCESIKLRSFNLLQKINDEPGSSGYIMIYVGKYEWTEFNDRGAQTIKQILPRFGDISYLRESIEGMLEFLGAPLDKIKIINGGYRENYSTEFWLVPKGAKSPEPQPTLKKMKFRKGKSRKFTYWDC